MTLEILPNKEKYEYLNGSTKAKINLSKRIKWHWL